ncbi:hypothetical protein FRC01_014019 [Tulasnella sp. 417]|nr:hypothetical protein FRC01_014019 [Tulasnella sp. 417]
MSNSAATHSVQPAFGDQKNENHIWGDEIRGVGQQETPSNHGRAVGSIDSSPPKNGRAAGSIEAPSNTGRAAGSIDNPPPPPPPNRLATEGSRE